MLNFFRTAIGYGAGQDAYWLTKTAWVVAALCLAVTVYH